MNKVLRSKESIKLLEALLQEGKTVPIRYTGNSMNPVFQEGDWLHIEKATPSNVRVGKIVLFEREGELTVHRVSLKWKQKGCFWVRTRGDTQIWIDPACQLKDLVGVVQAPKEASWKSYMKARLFLFVSGWHYVKMRLKRGV